MVKIKTGDGYEIHYDEGRKLFVGLIDGQEVAEAKSQQEVEDFIKKLTKAKFKRLPVIKRVYEGFYRGEITSVVKGEGYYGATMGVWFVRDDGMREKNRLQPKTFYQATPHNLTIAAIVGGLVEQIGKLKADINEHLDRLTDPITTENILLLGDKSEGQHD